jgi:hypothetical protein
VTGGRCAHCPAADGLPCRAGGFCDWAAAGDPVHLRHIAAVALRDAGRPTPAQPAVPCNEVAPATPGSILDGIPLAGNLVAAMTKRMGIDWVVKTVADELGVPCGCEDRQVKLNALDAKFRRFLGW